MTIIKSSTTQKQVMNGWWCCSIVFLLGESSLLCTTFVLLSILLIVENTRKAWCGLRDCMLGKHVLLKTSNHLPRCWLLYGTAVLLSHAADTVLCLRHKMLLTKASCRAVMSFWKSISLRACTFEHLRSFSMWESWRDFKGRGPSWYVVRFFI